MRTYEELNAKEQEQARIKALDNLLEAIISDGLRFNDVLNGDDLQARIDKASDKANAMLTPWFVAEYILDTCRTDLESIATADAEDALYPSQEEYIIRL